MQIKDKVVLLTGGANGLGFAHATELLRNGAAQPYHFDKTGVRILSFCPSLSYTQLITNLPGRGLQDIVSPDAIVAACDGEEGRTPEHVAQSLMHVIRVGENGSGWFVENGKPTYELAFPDVPVKKN